MNAESGHHLDDKITDPVGESLLASIADEPTAYRNLDKSRQDSLFDVKTLDVWEGPSGPRLLDHDYGVSRRLPNDLFEATNPAASHGERLMLRLLVTRPASVGNQLAWHDDLGKPGNKQIDYLPFVPEAMEDLIHQWDLPRSWPWLRLNAREVGNFARKTEWDFKVKPPRAVRIGIVLNFPFVLRPARQLAYLTEAKGGKVAGRRKANSEYNPWRDDPFIWSLALSHSLRDGKTRGLLDGVTDWAFDDISRRMLSGRHRTYQHPLHVPYVLLSIVFDHSAWEINRLAINVAEFENLSKNAQTQSLDQFDTITTQLQYQRRNLDFQQNLIDFMKETMQFLDTAVLQTADDPRKEPWSYATYVHETNPIFEERLTNISFLVKNNMNTCKYLQARTKDAMDYINAAIGLRDNEANKEDADSNKVMSMLQLAFLPATAVASIFSVNVINWSNNPVAVYNPAFYIFLVFLIIVTIVVLIVYFGAKRYDKLKDERETAEANEKEQNEDQQMYQPPVPDQAVKPSMRQRNGDRRHRSKPTSKDISDRPNDSGKNQSGYSKAGSVMV